MVKIVGRSSRTTHAKTWKPMLGGDVSGWGHLKGRGNGANARI
jgi:hypothetical protein